MWSLHITELVWIWNSPLDLPNSGTVPGSPTLQVDSLPFEPQEKPLLCYMGLKIWKPARCEDREICEEPHSVAGALTNTSLRPWSLLKDFTRTTVLSNSVKLSHAVWGYPGWTGHGGEVWQNVVHWRREWQTSSVFLSWEPHDQYEKAKR